MRKDNDISALLSVAMEAKTKTRKAAALTLVEAVRKELDGDQLVLIARAADRKHGEGVGAEVLMLAKEYGLG